jgi:hypothetical protein
MHDKKHFRRLLIILAFALHSILTIRSWDDWVPSERLRKHSEENLELARNLKREMDAINNQNKPTPKATVNKSGRKNSEARGSEERGFGQSKKRGRDLDTEREDQYNAKPAIRIPISDTIKSLLVDDWENITKNLQLVKVPSDTPVNKILDDYMTYEKARRSGEIVDPNGENDSASRSVELLEEVIAGLREYFNRALGRILLYRYERGQYEDVLGRMNNPNDDLSGKTIGDVYGAEHLLRLYGKHPTRYISVADESSVSPGTHGSNQHGSPVSGTRPRGARHFQRLDEQGRSGQTIPVCTIRVSRRRVPRTRKQLNNTELLSTHNTLNLDDESTPNLPYIYIAPYIA